MLKEERNFKIGDKVLYQSQKKTISGTIICLSRKKKICDIKGCGGHIFKNLQTAYIKL